MIELTGINLGQRQYEINKKVRELFTKNESFEEICAIQEKLDVDRLVKIDLANLHKNVKYLADALKCGDSLYVSRALKCTSLFQDRDIINPDYVHQNIIPFMSQKMKRKMFNTIAIKVKDQERIDSFYQYCLNSKLNDIAFKFLINASHHCKEEYLKSVIDIDNSIKFKFFFGNSDELINKYIQKKKKNSYFLSDDLFRFVYLFSTSNEKYLNLLEDCLEKGKCTYYKSYKHFGIRMSKIVMTKHKQRVIDKPWLYLGILDKNVITKYTLSHEAKKYAVALLPDKCEDFWYSNFYDTYAFFLDKIPAMEFYSFIKQIFNSKYPNELFEMNFSFYCSNYYKFMTAEEKCEWALKHIEEKKEHFGPLQDFKWYQFLKFNTAFFEIKKLIYVTKSADQRSDLIEVLVKAASLEEVGTLLSYYYDRHVNESSAVKERFIDQIVETHNLYQFDEETWIVFMKLLYSLEAFTPNQNSRFPILAVLYTIIHYKTIPQNLEAYCVFGRTFPNWTCLDKMDTEQKELAYIHLTDHLVNKIKEIIDTEKDLNRNDVKQKLILLIWSSITVIDTFKPQADLPELVMNVVKLYWDDFRFYTRFGDDLNKLTQGDLVRLLRKDKNLFLEKFPTNEKFDIRCTSLLKKIRVYFNDDLAKNIRDFYEKKLSQLYEDKSYYRSFSPIVFNLMQLSDGEFNAKLMKQYAPESPKIKHDEIDRNLLRIQEAICRFVYISRPPVPLSSVLMYLKGDYVPFCLPIFNSYSAHLPLPASLVFIECLIDSPISIQKHGLRLAFESYEVHNLIELITKIWNKTKNTSLRLIIFKTLVRKIKEMGDSDQIRLYEALKKFILSLRVEDADEIYKSLVDLTLPDFIFSNFLEDAWIAMDNLPLDSKVYINRRSEIISRIAKCLEGIDRTICKNIIKDHIDHMLVEKHILGYDDSYDISSLYQSKWSLIAKYITHFDDDKQLESSLEVLQTIMELCFEMWNEITVENYKKLPEFTVRKFLHHFLYSIKNNVPFTYDLDQKTKINPIFESIVNFFEQYLPINYVIILDFKLDILFRNIIANDEEEEDEGISYDDLKYEKVGREMSQCIIDLASKKFYPSLTKTFADKITSNITEAVNATTLGSDQLLMTVSSFLSEQPKYDLCLLALYIIPKDGYKEYPNEFQVIANNILSSHDYDLNSYLYHNFICSDFINRIPPLM